MAVYHEGRGETRRNARKQDLIQLYWMAYVFHEIRWRGEARAGGDIISYFKSTKEETQEEVADIQETLT